MDLYEILRKYAENGLEVLLESIADNLNITYYVENDCGVITVNIFTFIDGGEEFLMAFEFSQDGQLVQEV